MKQLRTFGMVLAVFCLMTSAAMAAKPGKVKGARENGPVERFREICAQLNLTDEQKPKVDQALSDLEQKLQEARQDAKGDKEAAKGKVREAVTAFRTQVSAVLTAEQKAKLRELMSERKTDKKGAATQPAKQD